MLTRDLAGSKISSHDGDRSSVLFSRIPNAPFPSFKVTFALSINASSLSSLKKPYANPDVASTVILFPSALNSPIMVTNSCSTSLPKESTISCGTFTVREPSSL